jgi:hypothetical protein
MTATETAMLASVEARATDWPRMTPCLHRRRQRVRKIGTESYVALAVASSIAISPEAASSNLSI